MNLDELEQSSSSVNSDERELDNSPELDDGVYEDDSVYEEESTETNEPEDITEEDIVIDNDIESEEDNESEEEVSIENTEDVDNNEEVITFDLGSTKVEVKDKNELKAITENALKDKVKFDKYKDDIAIIEGLKDNGVEEEDLYLLAEAKKGNTKALAKLLKKANIDPMDLDPDDEEVENYKPEEVKADMQYVEARSLLNDIQSDKELSTKFDNLVMKEFDESSRQEVFKDVNNLKFVTELTKSGLLEQVLPTYTKMKLLGEQGNSFQLLVKAWDTYSKQLEQTKQEVATKKTKENEDKATKRKKVSTGSKTKNTPKPKTKSVDEMTDEEFEKYYQEMTGGFGFSVD